MNISWVKLSVSMFDDDKIKIIESMENGYEYIVIWVKLLCIAGKKNSDGCIYLVKELPIDEAMLARVSGHNIDVFRAALRIFEGFSMISVIDNGHLKLNNWEKYQDKLKSYDDVLNQNAIRQQKFRNKTNDTLKKLGIDNQRVVPSRYESRYVTPQEGEREGQNEKKSEENLEIETEFSEEKTFPIQNFSNLPDNNNSLSVGTKDLPLPSPSNTPLPPDIKTLGVKMCDLLRKRMRSEMDDILSRTELDLPTLSEMFAEYWVYNKGREFDPKNHKGITSSFQKWFDVGGSKEIPTKEISNGIKGKTIMEEIIEIVRKKKGIEMTSDEATAVKKFLAETILTDEQLKMEVTRRFLMGGGITWKTWLSIAANVQVEELYHRRLNGKV